MGRSLILTNEEEVQRQIDFFALKEAQFIQKWHISTITARKLYGNKKIGFKKIFTEEEMLQARIDYIEMPLRLFIKKYKTGTARARQLFGPKTRIRKGKPLTDEQKEKSKEHYNNVNSEIEDNYEKAMRMFDISKNQVEELLKIGGRIFSEIFAGEKVNGKVIPKNLFPKKVYRN